MTDRLIAIKITSDGRAFVVDQAANADAVKKFGKELDTAGAQAEQMGAKVKRAARDVKEVGASVEPVAPAVKRVEDQMRKLGATSAASAHQLRMVAPQVTDIVTQLAAGQSPFMIAIQQGGQLKDVFGGVGPAARALGSYIGGMITPLTVSAGAVGVLAFAWLKAQEQAASFARQVLLTGNAAGATIGQYHGMADGLVRIGGSKGAALDAIAAFAQAGKVGADELQRYTGIGQQIERLVGKPVADTAKEFGALAEAPVAASLKLTETYNYLTAEVYRQIKALEDQGRHVEAAKLAQEAFADALDGRMPQMTAHLTHIEKLWISIKQAISGAANSVVAGMMPATLEQQLATVKAAIAKGQGKFDASAFGGNAEERANLSKNLALEASLERQIEMEKRAAIAAAERLANTKARAVWDKGAEESLDKQEKLARAIAKVENEGAAAGATRAEIEKRIANERKKYIDTDAVSAQQDALSARIAAMRRAGEVMAVEAKATQQKIDAEYKLGVINQTEFINQTAANDLKLLQSKRDGVAQEISIARLKKNSLREVSDLQGQLAAKDAEILARARKAEADVESAHQAKVLAARKFYEDQAAEHRRELAEAKVAQDKLYDGVTATVQEYVQAIADESKATEFQISLIGKSATEQRRLNELRRIDIALAKEKKRIDEAGSGGKLTGAQLAELKGKADAAAVQAAADVATNIWINEWNRANDIVGGGLYDILTGRGEDASKKLGRMFEQLVLRPQIMASLQGISGSIASLVTGGAPSGVGQAGGSALSGVGSAASLYGAGSGIVNGAIAGYAGAGAVTAGGATTFGVVGASTAGTTVVGGAAGGLSGAAAGALAAIPVAGWIALAAVAAYSIFGGKGGGPKTEIGEGFGINGTNGREWGDAAAKKLTDGIEAAFANVAKSLGITSQFQAGVFVSQDPEGDSPTQVQVTGAVNGQGVYNRGDRLGGIENVGRGDGDVEATFVEETIRNVFKAVQASDLADEFKQILNAVAADAGVDEMQAALDRVVGAKQQRAQLEEQLLTLTSSAVENVARARKRELEAADPTNRALMEQVFAQQDLLQATEATTAAAQAQAAGLRSYQDNFYSAGEKRTRTAQGILETVNAATGQNMGIEAVLGASRQTFRNVVESLDTTTEGGKRTYDAMMSVADAFASITEPVNDAASAVSNAASQTQTYTQAIQDQSEALASSRAGIRDFIRQLSSSRMGTATPEALLAATRNSYLSDLSAAKKNDVNAIGRITGSAQAYLEAQKGYTASGSMTQAVIDQVLRELKGVAGGGDPTSQIVANTAETARRIGELEASNQQLRGDLQTLIGLTADIGARTIAGQDLIAANTGSTATAVQLQATAAPV